MGLLVSQPMGKKDEFIRIRADAELKQALAESAKLHPGRKQTRRATSS